MRPPFLLIASALLLVVLAVTFAASGAFAADDSAVYVAPAANQIIALLPDAAKAVGATPESLQTLIVGEVGKLQAISTGGPTATATASNPDGSSTTVTAKG